MREHPRKLIEMVMVAVDRCITRRETPEGRKLAVLDSHSKVRGSQHAAHHTAQHWRGLRDGRAASIIRSASHTGRAAVLTLFCPDGCPAGG